MEYSLETTSALHGFMGLFDCCQISVGAGAGANYHYTPDDQRNSRADQLFYPCIFAFDLRFQFTKIAQVYTVSFFVYDDDRWVQLVDRPYLGGLSHSSAFHGFFGKDTGNAKRQAIPQDPLRSLRIDACYLGYFNDPYRHRRGVGHWPYHDCYMLLETSRGTWFAFLTVPELNHNMKTTSALIVGSVLHLPQMDDDSTRLIESEAKRRNIHFDDERKGMRARKCHLTVF